MDQQTLHFSIGPVQQFVGQSRRTRDLWASSFLLSYLAGVAIETILGSDPDAVMELPSIRDDHGHLNKLLCAIRHDAPGGSGRSFGSLPNRFQVRCSNPADIARAARDAVQERWQEIAEAVWVECVEQAAQHGKNTRGIWQNQIENFWSIYWVVSEEPDALDRRKNWRHRFPPPQHGDKCTMMHRWQELSGWTGIKNREGQRDFWDAVRGADRVDGLDLRENERLCAIALVKRMFPLCSERVIGRRLNVKNWPSTAYMAAAPWLAHLADDQPEAGREYAQKVLQKRSAAGGEGDTRLATLDDHPNRGRVGELFNLDGNSFLSEAVENRNATPFDEDKHLPEGETGRGRACIREELDKLYDQLDGTEPSRFYALLLMDGDKMGEILQKAAATADDAAARVSRALTSFSRSVGRVFNELDGVLIYAGGDDVLALITLPDAFSAAAQIRAAYAAAFHGLDDGPGLGLPFTISAGIVFAHYKYPLRDVLAEAHHLLDEVAKDRTGRDSVAVSVLKPGGKLYEWAMPWKKALCGPERIILQDLADAWDDDIFSTSFLYRLRDLLMLLSPNGTWKPGMTLPVPDDFDLDAIVRAEYIHSKDEEVDVESADRAVNPLLRAARRIKRILKDDGTVEWQRRFSTKTDNSDTDPQQQIRFDAWLLTRFLAQQQVWDREAEPE